MRIFRYPEPVLRETCAEVDPATDEDLDRLISRMRDAMYEAPGIGLAAPQIGVQKQVVVYDVDGELRVVLNPRLVSSSEETVTEEEGCLSVPGVSIPIERPSSIVVEGIGRDGSPVRIEADDLLARVLQHEIDHINGHLILDRANRSERKAALRRYREAQREQGD